MRTLLHRVDWLVGLFSVGLFSIGQGLVFSCQESDEPSPAAAQEFFESKIRPILIDHCYECHSQSTERSGGLWLDHRDAWRQGGDSGPAIAVGEPDLSLLIEAIDYTNPHLRMPPQGRLAQDQIDAMRQWIAGGAFDPRVDPAKPVVKPGALQVEDALQHWAYRPIGRPPLPMIELHHDRGASTAIDAFLQANHHEFGLTPTELVDRATFLRRLSIDLLGLNPTPDELLAFAEDDRPDAMSRQIDRMLASPRFAERMARHWLDVVRYAESLTLRGFVLPNAWRYRDYVIDAFAEDRPIDEFFQEQIAGDLLPSQTLQERQRRQIAISFLLLGNTNLEEQDKKQLEMDIVDEQLDTLGRALLGQTLGCARCHDHKFDPIPTRDYYALAAILREWKVVEHENVSKWIEISLPMSAEESDHYRRLGAESQRLKDRILEIEKSLKGPVSDRIVDPTQLPGVVVDDVMASRIGLWKDSSSIKAYVGQGYLHDEAKERGAKTVTFQPPPLEPGDYEVRLAYSHGDNRATNALIRVFSADGEKEIRIDQRKPGPIDDLWISLGQFRFEKGGLAFVLLSNEQADGHVIADAVQFLPSSERFDSTNRPASNLAIEKSGLESSLKELRQESARLEEQLSQIPKSMMMREEEATQPMRIHLRGNVHTLGAEVAHGYLSLVRTIDGQDNTHWTQPSNANRLTLAQWLTHPQHPLTARVYVNRVWYWMMGEGLVRSMDHFGTTGDSPSHPELLDYLTHRFIQCGWSTKALVREIVGTDAYRRSARSEPGSESVDPENRYYWRGHRKRMDAESIRDSILQASGELDFSMKGRRFPKKLEADYGYEHLESCRSVYLPAFRNAYPSLLRSFDMADPSMVVGKRDRTTVPQQALILLNDPWIADRVHATATRILRANENFESAVDSLCLMMWSRRANPDEMLAFRETIGIDETGLATRQSWEVIIKSILSSLDFRYLE